MVRSAKDWEWSSYRSTAGLIEQESWLSTDWLLSLFSKRRKQAQLSYREFVKQGKNQPRIWQSLSHSGQPFGSGLTIHMHLDLAINRLSID